MGGACAQEVHRTKALPVGLVATCPASSSPPPLLSCSSSSFPARASFCGRLQLELQAAILEMCASSGSVCGAGAGVSQGPATLDGCRPRASARRRSRSRHGCPGRLTSRAARPGACLVTRMGSCGLRHRLGVLAALWGLFGVSGKPRSRCVSLSLVFLIGTGSGSEYGSGICAAPTRRTTHTTRSLLWFGTDAPCRTHMCRASTEAPAVEFHLKATGGALRGGRTLWSSSPPRQLETTSESMCG